MNTQMEYMQMQDAGIKTIATSISLVAQFYTSYHLNDLFVKELGPP